MFCESLSSTFLIKKKMLRFQRSIFRVYMDRFNRKKDPIVMFMGHLGVPTKKIVKGNECFIFYFCVLCSAGYANYSVYVPFGYFGVLHAIR